MVMRFRDGQWDLVVPTSMGVRITPVGGLPVHQATNFTLQATSAETNVASIFSSLGLRSKVLTRFVKNSPIANFIKGNLASRGMDVEGLEIPQGDAWGYRHQFNITDSGYGVRAPQVWNDRAGEVGLGLSAKDFDLEKIFAREGVKILHLSGIVAALSPDTSKACLEIARFAKTQGTAVCFDLNYRASFWKGRETELRKVFQEIGSLSDVLFGNEEDFQLALGIDGPDSGGKDLAGKINGFQEMIGSISRAFPEAQYVGTSLREARSANRHLWGMIVAHEGEVSVAEPREIDVLDRIGGGDASVGGLLYGILRGFDTDRAMRFAWACGALAASVPTDYLQIGSEEEVWSAWEGNARVKR